MITFSNLGADGAPSVSLPTPTALALLDALVDAGRTMACGRWEVELAAWLADRRGALEACARSGLDLIEVAWTPDHFADQQRFVIAVCDAAADRNVGDATLHGALAHVRALVAAHRRGQIAFGRRWRWTAGRPALPEAAGLPAAPGKLL